MTTVSAWSSPTECDLSGHQTPISWVNRRNACSGVARTVTTFTMGLKGLAAEVLVTDLLLEGSRVRLQRIPPHPIQILPQHGEAGRIELIEPASPDGASPDQARAPEHREMLRNRRLGDAQVLRQLTHGARAVSQPFDQPSPGRVGQGRHGQIISHY
jgi:hypothetical protein